MEGQKSDFAFNYDAYEMELNINDTFGKKE